MQRKETRKENTFRQATQKKMTIWKYLLWFENLLSSLYFWFSFTASPMVIPAYQQVAVGSTALFVCLPLITNWTSETFVSAHWMDDNVIYSLGPVLEIEVTSGMTGASMYTCSPGRDGGLDVPPGGRKRRQMSLDVLGTVTLEGELWLVDFHVSSQRYYQDRHKMTPPPPPPKKITALELEVGNRLVCKATGCRAGLSNHFGQVPLSLQKKK